MLKYGKQVDNNVAMPLDLMPTFLQTSPSLTFSSPYPSTSLPFSFHTHSNKPIPKLKAPYPNRLKKSSQHVEKVLKIFQLMKVNFLLLDIIQHVPSYVKFIKDFYSLKRDRNILEKVFLTAKTFPNLL